MQVFSDEYTKDWKVRDGCIDDNTDDCVTDIRDLFVFDRLGVSPF